MVFTFAFKNIKPFWSLKTDYNKFINIAKVVKYLGNDLALKLPHIHAIPGCDTTSFVSSGGKVKILKKYMKQVSLLNGFGETSTVDNKVSQNVSKFIQSDFIRK